VICFLDVSLETYQVQAAEQYKSHDAQWFCPCTASLAASISHDCAFHEFALTSQWCHRIGVHSVTVDMHTAHPEKLQ
jgi:hypothetical protein